MWSQSSAVDIYTTLASFTQQFRLPRLPSSRVSTYFSLETPILWSWELYRCQPCQWKNCYYPFLGTAGTWSDKGDRLPAGKQKRMSQTTAKSACTKNQISLSLWLSYTTKKNLSKGGSIMDHEIFTTVCFLDTQCVVLEKGYRKAGCHQGHLLSEGIF